MIPKRIFFYWSGNNLSWMRYMTLYSFRKFNPDWDITLYLSDNNNDVKTWVGTEEQDFLNYKGKNYLSEVEKLNINIKKVILPSEVKKKLINISPVHESDLFRYYELYKNGGFYCDMDVIFFRSMDDYYKTTTDNNIDTVLYQCPMYMAIGFLGSSKNNEYYNHLFQLGVTHFKMDDYQSLGVGLIYGLFGGSKSNAIVLDSIEKRFPQLNIQSIPTSLVYYYDWTKIKYNFNNSIPVEDFPMDSIGYHWFGGSKVSQFYNNRMNENNYMNYKTTFSTIAKKVLS
jgi:glycosyl transferase-like sugar-binding protein